MSLTVGQGAWRDGPRRGAIAVLAVAGTLAVVLAGAILTPDGVGGLNLAVERAAGGSSGLLGNFSLALPFGFAFAAGMVSSVNPCGFSLLPAYLGLFLAEPEDEAQATRLSRLVRALGIAAAVTLAFVLLFSTVGLAIGLGARALADWLPWAAVVMGFGLIAVGGYRLAGGTLYTALPERVGARLGAGIPGAPGYFLFGLSYGLGSLSCTLPIFLAVVGSSVTGATLGPSVGALLLYSLGMGSVIVALTLAIALFKSALTMRLRSLVRYTEPIGTVALFLAGGYVIYYWLTLGGLLAAFT
ncbi:MAG: cytochrome c biogenesis protein CcdA [Dehalococcoidia bacterium]